MEKNVHASRLRDSHGSNRVTNDFVINIVLSAVAKLIQKLLSKLISKLRNLFCGISTRLQSLNTAVEHAHLYRTANDMSSRSSRSTLFGKSRLLLHHNNNNNSSIMETTRGTRVLASAAAGHPLLPRRSFVDAFHGR